jgi:biopolymer transport protein ExbD
MATLSVGGSVGGKRPLDHDIPLIPFIDFLLCLIAFLLVTAVWSQMAQLSASALVPGKDEQPIADVRPKMLHVRIKDSRFELEWRREGTVFTNGVVERRPILVADGQPRYPELANRLAEEWRHNGEHRAASDPRQDIAVVHASNTLPYADLAAVMDALHAPKRWSTASNAEVPAFSVSFAAD